MLSTIKWLAFGVVVLVFGMMIGAATGFVIEFLFGL
jgi:hypothetical protein